MPTEESAARVRILDFKKHLKTWLLTEKQLGIEGQDGESDPRDPDNVLWIEYLDYLIAMAEEFEGYGDPPSLDLTQEGRS